MLICFLENKCFENICSSFLFYDVPDGALSRSTASYDWQVSLVAQWKTGHFLENYFKCDDFSVFHGAHLVQHILLFFFSFSLYEMLISKHVWYVIVYACFLLQNHVLSPEIFSSCYFSCYTYSYLAGIPVSVSVL